MVGLADIIAPAYGSLPGVVSPLRGGACRAFAMPFGDFLLDPSGQHTDALDFLPSIKVCGRPDTPPSPRHVVSASLMPRGMTTT